MNEPTLRQLRFLVAVADHGSLQAAARALHMSPTGLSLGLDELEHVIGVPLTVRRRAKGAALTPAGRAVVAQAREIHTAVTELSTIANQLHGKLVGSVGVGCFPSLSPTLIPELLERLEQTYPELQVEVLESPADELQARLREGDLELACMFESQVDSDLEFIRLMPTKSRVQISPRHRFGRRRGLRLAELVEERLVLLDIGPHAEATLALFGDRGLTPRILASTANIETVRSLVARGMGYTITMARVMRHDSIEGWPLVYIPLTDPLPENSVVVAHRPDVSLTARAEAVFASLRSIGISTGQIQNNPNR
ncbi:LysR family transcriptional regulator [Enemella evansiae]|uniref:LysR family transcriptional regulator n=1 Tax=Enemella evansiae TaxID=2016499 RepID=UPI000B96E3E5|nr:LysR family transcriptional regulator [Enemella evansiae]OYO06785.1 hypothetical protein CGZ95_00420 [Enemella evansiae]TDO91590.1 DNA-binding transcriptional LysR family regulator [Enemella evansiae]